LIKTCPYDEKKIVMPAHFFRESGESMGMAFDRFLIGNLGGFFFFTD